MDSNILFIVNPKSRSGEAIKIWEKKILPQVLMFFPDANWVFTTRQYEASLLAYSAKKRGYDIVVAVGGDGTINEIVNGLLGNQLLNSNPSNFPEIFGSPLKLNNLTDNNSTPSLAFIPLGTGSDFIKSIGIPKNINKALTIIKQRKSIITDVGYIEFQNESFHPRYFINIAGCGANGETVKRLNESDKKFGKRGAFLIAAIKTLLKNQSFPVQISFDNESYIPFDLRVLFICNGQYCGGGMRISRDASLNNGKFKVVQIRKMNKIKSIFLLNRLYSGNYKGLENDIIEREATTIKIKSLENAIVPAESDGEMPGYLPASFSIKPNKLSIIAKI